MLTVQKILCPTDFSAFAAVAVNEGAALAHEFDAELDLLHVTQPVMPIADNTPIMAYAGLNQAHFEQEIRDSACAQLDEMKSRPQFADLEIATLVEQGESAATIARVAARQNSDLIVLSTHGLTGWRNRIFGSVAEKVLRIAPCNVLVSRVETAGGLNLELPLRKILCATDWSEPSLQALEVAAQWAAHFGAELVVLHAVKPIESAGMLMSMEQIEESICREAAHRLHEIVRERLPNLPDVKTLVFSGSAADVIARVAGDEQADLLVLATQGASGWRAALAGTPIADLLFGSVTNNVLQLTSCPVLTVRTRSDEK